MIRQLRPYGTASVSALQIQASNRPKVGASVLLALRRTGSRSLYFAPNTAPLIAIFGNKRPLMSSSGVDRTVGPKLLWISRHEILDHGTSELAELFEAAGVVVGELVVIEPQQTQAA